MHGAPTHATRVNLLRTDDGGVVRHENEVSRLNSEKFVGIQCITGNFIAVQ